MNRLPVAARVGLPPLAILVIGGSLPFWFIPDQYALVIAITAVIWAIAGQGWNIIGGYGGLLSFGHSVFFGIGAYVTAMMQVRLGVTPWIGMIVGALLSALVGAILTFPALRLKGIYFTLATFVLALLLTDLAVINREVTGGDLGISLPFVADDPSMMQFGSRVTLYFVVLAFLAVATLVVALVAFSRLGLYLRATRDDPDAARAAGVNVTRVRLIGLMISAAITSIAGSLMLEYLGSVTPATGFGAAAAFIIAMVALVGGKGTILGPVVGAMILIPAQQYISSAFVTGPLGLSGIIYSLVIIAVILIDSRGIVHVFGRIARWVAARVRRRPAVTEGAAS
jgi:branched-chain amino acid transport system permease protein